jgi:glyoxylase-like metal-dependent hydrolase (beta-lactamase superfamily II)
MFRDAIDKKSDGRDRMADDERAAYEASIAIAQEYVVRHTDLPADVPTKTFDRSLILKRGDRVIELHYYGPAVTRGDAVVYLPNEGVLVTGDLYDNPVPFGYGCNVDGWIGALDSLDALGASIIVPGHGAVTRGPDQGMKTLRGYLETIQTQVRDAAARGVVPPEIQKQVAVHSEGTGQNKMLQFLFDNFFVGPVVGSVYKEATTLETLSTRLESHSMVRSRTMKSGTQSYYPSRWIASSSASRCWCSSRS